MEQLRRLHSIPTQRAQMYALIIGVLGTLILGTGMSLAMTDIGAALGTGAMAIGIAVGVVGMVLVALAYPTYNYALKKQRKKLHRRSCASPMNC